MPTEQVLGNFGDYYVCVNPRCSRFLQRVKHPAFAEKPKKCLVCGGKMHQVAGTWIQ